MARHPVLARAMALAALTLAMASACRRAPQPQTTEQLLREGKAYAAQQKDAEAILQFRKAVQMDPKFGEAHYELALAYLRSNAPAAALDELLKAAELMPDHIDVNLSAGQLLLLGNATVMRTSGRSESSPRTPAT
jgi:tetratricopeptide (TPR) repeat protein